jgi:hypothetical protein
MRIFNFAVIPELLDEANSNVGCEELHSHRAIKYLQLELRVLDHVSGRV